MRPLIEAELVSVAVSIVLTALILVIVRGELARRYAGAIGFAAGYFAAYAWLQPRNLTPSMSWHWIAWLAIPASFIGPISLAAGVRTPERWILAGIFALVASWFLVPTWPALLPVRMTYVALVAGALILSWNLLDPLIRRGAIRPVAFALLVTSISSSALIAYLVSLRIGSLGAIGTTALTGGVLAAIWTSDGTILRGMLAAHGLVVCGVVLTAYLNEGLPKYSPAWILVAPLTQWLFEFGPLARLRGVSGVMARAVAITLPLAAAWFI